MRIFVTPLAPGELVVRGDEHHYLARVRRAAVGDAVELVDGEGLRAAAEIVAITDDETRLQVGDVTQIADLPPRIRALVPLIKGDRMDTCIEKLVEAGVDEIVVWPAARAVVKLDAERRPGRIAHYQSVSQSAARQSGRASVPTVTWADSLAAALADVASSVRLALDPLADRADLAALLAAPDAPVFDPRDARAFDESTDVAVTGRFQRPPIRPADARDPDDVTSTGRFVRPGAVAENPRFVASVALASGPEGGLAPDELDALSTAGFTAIGLGPRVLRAETAPVIAVALVRAATES